MSWDIIVTRGPNFILVYLLLILYSRFLLQGPNICEICEHYLNLQKFLLVASFHSIFFMQNTKFFSQIFK